MAEFEKLGSHSFSAVRPYLKLDTLTSLALFEALQYAKYRHDSSNHIQVSQTSYLFKAVDTCAPIEAPPPKSIHSHSMHKSSDIPNAESLIPTAASNPAFASK